MDKPLIETVSLDFSFGKDNKILSGLSLSVPHQSIYCFLGPNGAGKTTTIKILLGLLKCQPGKVKLFDQDLESNRISILRRIGSLIEQPSLYLHLTATENLEVFSLTYQCDKKRIKEVLEITGLHGAENKQAGKFSLGMKQRLGIALALLHDPELLILDEPTNGLDPQGIVEIRELLLTLNREFSKTIFVSSHLLSEVEKIATHVGIIHQGKIMFQGTSNSLIEITTQQNSFEIETENAETTLSILQNEFNASKKDEYKIIIKNTSKEMRATAIQILSEKRIKIYNAMFVRQNLEELFLNITKP